MFPPLDQSSSNPTGEDSGEPDDYDVEETLAQVMQDEFEVQIEDDSIVPVCWIRDCGIFGVGIGYVLI